MTKTWFCTLNFLHFVTYSVNFWKFCIKYAKSYFCLFEAFIKLFGKIQKCFEALLTLIERGSWMLLESGGGGWISPHILDHLKTLWKTNFFFDFLKVHNDGPPNPFFHGEIAIWKCVGTLCPPCTIRVKPLKMYS